MSFLQGISVRLSSQVLPFSFATWSHKHRTGSAEWLWEGREHPRSILLTHLRPDSSHPEASVFDVAVGCWCDDYLYRQYSYIIISCCRLLNVVHFRPNRSILHPWIGLVSQIRNKDSRTGVPTSKAKTSIKVGDSQVVLSDPPSWFSRPSQSPFLEYFPALANQGSWSP
jgi:hypothetical protein